MVTLIGSIIDKVVLITLAVAGVFFAVKTKSKSNYNEAVNDKQVEIFNKLRDNSRSGDVRKRMQRWSRSADQAGH